MRFVQFFHGESTKVDGIVLVCVDDPSAVTSGQQARLDTSEVLALSARIQFCITPQLPPKA